ncbi:MAG: ROK family transcriptional regulator [Anaerolineae bacterium]|nr:ROK family transcriptional regulator [Anaerolineae bacterium]MDH7473516.1 ROK family transcriptional regulator [Anaerolineae bacterium]
MSKKLLTADLGLMRDFNKALVLSLIHRQGTISRAEIAKRTNLSRSTVSNIATELLAANLVRESGIGQSQGGRRPILLEFNYQAGYVVGVELGATHVVVIVADLEPRIIVELEQDFDLTIGPEAGLCRVAELARQALAQAGVNPEQVVGIGLGVPGPVRHEMGTVIFPPIMPGWHGFPLRDRLEKELGTAVYLDNDANLGALGEWAHGAGQGVDNLAYIKVGTGIGCGLLIDGQIYRGQSGSAGEIGHITIDENGPPCRCGNYGCLESMAAGPAIAHRAQLAIKAGQETMLSKAKPVEEITAADVSRAASQGDPLSLQLFHEAGRHIGVALAGLINLFNPKLVIIGGGVARAGDVLLEPIRRSVQSHGLRTAVENCQIVQAQLGREATALGAVTLVLEKMFRSPQLSLAVSTPLPVGL